MPALKHLFSALALASSAFAQCSTKGTMTITNSAQATQVAMCSTFQGSIALDKKVSGDIALDGLQQISGDLMASDAKNLNSFSASNLQSIEGQFNLTELVGISTLSFPMLTKVESLYFQSLGPGLSTPDFSGGITTIKDLFIDQCSFTSLAGLTPDMAESVTLTNNQLISKLTLPLTTVKGPIIVRGNVANFQLSMPKLKSAGNIQLNNCSSILLPSLTKVGDAGLSIVGNVIKSFSVPKLVTTAVFQVDENDDMTSLSAPLLKTVTGAFSVQNNKKLTGTLSFPKLQMINGGPRIVGEFSALKLPDLNRVLGSMFVQSTKNIKSSCNTLEHTTGIASLTCKSAAGHTSTKPENSHHPSSNGGNPNSGSSNGGNGGGSGAAGHVGASLGLIFTVFAGVSAFFAVLC